MNEFRRSEDNPVLLPNKDNDWESEATFNGCPIIHSQRIHFFYRAVSSSQRVQGIEMNLSTIGHALSTDGTHFKHRRQFIKPEYDWELFGCEDPRVTRVGNKFYIFYTALSAYPFTADSIRVGLAISPDCRQIEAKYPVTTFNSKAMVLFPGKIRGKLAAVLSVNTDKPPAKIGLAFFDREDQIWAPEYWEGWYSFLDDHILPLQRSPQDQIEVGAPPIRTSHGWLLIYAYIRNYFSPPATFGIEGALLDLENPSRILARTEEPWLVSQDVYEEYGKVPNVIFPSGALLRGKTLHLYYGAADTTCALATAKVSTLIQNMLLTELETVKLERFFANPVIQPDSKHPWESKAVFNPAAIYEDNKVHLVYRAMSEDNTSVLGYAASTDGFNFNERYDKPLYVPREDFEQKLVPGGNSGCEDPRLTRLGDTVYMCYTAFNGKNMPRVAFTSIALDDFLARNWKRWAKPVLISRPRTMDKDAALFPRKIKDKYAFLHRLGTSVWLDFKDSLSFGEGEWLGGTVILSSKQESLPVEKIGVSAPPIETKQGWLLLYHFVTSAQRHDPQFHYDVSAALLDINDPTRVLARRRTPLLEPEMSYEREGQVANVVFPCGAVVIHDRLFVYYGGADTVIGVATINLLDLMESLMLCEVDNSASC
jgi:predicted GH43/DUF377 family glycosyl hydrolase